MVIVILEEVGEVVTAVIVAVVVGVVQADTVTGQADHMM